MVDGYICRECGSRWETAARCPCGSWPEPADTEAAAVWERLTPARLRLLRLIAAGSIYTGAHAVRSVVRVIDGLIALGLAAWNRDRSRLLLTDLGRRVAEHGRKAKP